MTFFYNTWSPAILIFWKKNVAFLVVDFIEFVRYKAQTCLSSNIPSHYIHGTWFPRKLPSPMPGDGSKRRAQRWCDHCDIESPGKWQVSVYILPNTPRQRAQYPKNLRLILADMWYVIKDINFTNNEEAVTRCLSRVILQPPAPTSSEPAPSISISCSLIELVKNVISGPLTVHPNIHSPKEFLVSGNLFEMYLNVNLNHYTIGLGWSPSFPIISKDSKASIELNLARPCPRGGHWDGHIQLYVEESLCLTNVFLWPRIHYSTIVA